MSHLKSIENLKLLLEVVARLRSPDGCPWDKEQTHASLKPFLIEETAEFLDAVDDCDDEGMCEELGDILLHIVFHADIAEKEGRFSFDDITFHIKEKLIRRHPHVFGEETAENPDDVLVIWQNAKNKEKKSQNRTDRFAGIPRHLPALQRAEEYQKKAAKVGFDWECQNDIVDKITEELHELKEALKSGNEKNIDEEIGDLLFAVTNLSRFRKRAAAEELLAAAITKFRDRFRFIENELNKNGKKTESATIEEMEALWNLAKKELL
jgi:tetrapyrrole methylase family protein/MazG family protein